MKGWHVEPFACGSKTQQLIFHRNNPMLIIKNHTFIPFDGTTNIVILTNKMANHTMHNLR
jgi:hypothetical protein